MDRKQLHGDILQDLKARSVWESRQTTWYKMRHDGLRRRYKPWPNASDLHYPLADTVIGKLKPYYAEQLWATETPATFVCKRCNQNAQLTTAAAHYFDYQCKQNSNLEESVLTWVDTMLQGGRSVMKVTWNPTKKRVEYHPINPLNIIVPPWTKDIESADRITHVIQMSVAAYKLNPNYEQGDELLRLIRGKGIAKESDTGQQEAEKFLREGITHGETDDQIVLWEVYSKDDKGKWQVHTFSPVHPERAVRDSMAVPYRHGQPPFVDACYEIKDEGWYSPRGVVEQLAAFEASLCRLWNEKHDFMTLVNKPLFKNDGATNTSNFQMHPGQVLPRGLDPVIMQQPPVSFDQEMVSTRQVAEQRVSMPDFGMNQVMANRDRRTAEEIRSINGVMGNSLDLRTRIFRRSLGKLYRMAWGLYCEFSTEDLQYFFDGMSVALPKDALHGEYEILPTGSADGVNKSYLMQKAVTRYQMFNGNPFVKQDALVQSVLEQDDVALVKRLMANPQADTLDQQEDQAQEISILRDGFPAQVKPTDNHPIHIETCLGYLEKQSQTGQPFDPMAAQRINEHIAQHMQALQQADPKAFKALQAKMQAMAGQGAQP